MDARPMMTWLTLVFSRRFAKAQAEMSANSAGRQNFGSYDWLGLNAATSHSPMVLPWDHLARTEATHPKPWRQGEDLHPL